MTEYEKALEYYQSLTPTLFDILDHFEVRQPHQSQDEEYEVSLEIQLRPLENEEEDPRRLRLSFFGVRNLTVNFQGFMHFSLIRIRLIRHYQWEKLNYEVEDAEKHTFSFVCKEFKASLLANEEELHA